MQHITSSKPNARRTADLQAFTDWLAALEALTPGLLGHTPDKAEAMGPKGSSSANLRKCCPQQPEPENLVQTEFEFTDEVQADPERSNVTFFPGNTNADTQIYVGDCAMTGVGSVKLEYDVDLGFPVLRLEIINPYIGSAVGSE